MTETQVWGLKHPETPQEEWDYQEDLQGAICDLLELGFSCTIVESYKRKVLVIQSKTVTERIHRQFRDHIDKLSRQLGAA